MPLSRRTFLQSLSSGTAALGLSTLLPPWLGAETAAAVFHLPRSTPEAEGVSSAGIAAFLNGITQHKHELHGFMMARHGKVIAEGWWAPYGPDLKHTLYSISKSFTSTAVGFAVAEGKLSVEDKVTSFFPGDLPEKVSENLAALQVKHLLTMSVGNEKEPTGAVVQQENWVKAFLAAPIVHAPGTQFMYNSTATYMLSAIVQKVTGQKIVDYLRPRLFDPLGITDASWEVCPRGINTGGWGLSVQTESLAKFGQLYLQKGQWQGRQILPAAWVEEATTFKIQQPGPSKGAKPKEQNDWLQGYCYQFWRCRHNAFRGDGAFGQYTIVMPDQQTVIAMNSETNGMQDVLDLVWEHLLPAIQEHALPEDQAQLQPLQKTLADLSLPPVKGQAVPSTAARVGGKTFKLAENALGLTSVALTFSDAAGVATFGTAVGNHAITVGLGQWERGQTSLPGTPPRLISGGAPPKGTAFKVAASGAWKDENTFEMLWRYYETPHHDTVVFHFEGDKLSVKFTASIGKEARPVLEGTVG